MARRTILITGASTGLGLALGRLLLERTDDRLVLTARASSMSRFAEEGIEQGERAWLRQLDVTSADQRATLITELEEAGGVDVLVNNAAISYRSVIEHVTEEERLAQMQVNFQAPIALAQLVLPSMRERRAGHIINVSSAGGIMAVPTMGIYAASKFALEAATEALYYELMPWNVRVTLIMPGFINSEGFERVILSGQSRHAIADPADPYHRHYAHMIRFVEWVMRRTPSTSESVARTILRAMQRRRPSLRVPATWDARLLWWLRRHVPPRLYHAAVHACLPRVRRWGPHGPSVAAPLVLPERVTIQERPPG